MSVPSRYAVAARRTADVVAAINFARSHNLRLVVKGGGHSYQGTSNAPDSLLVWTRAMKEAEVEVSSKREIRTHRIIVAADIGTVGNRLGASAQVEGLVVFALSATLKHEITVTDGRVVQGNFNDFPVIRMSETPRIDVHFVPSTDTPLGCGEAAVPAVAPAMANAIFAATGKRLRRLPIRAQDLVR
jgi:CO/xanthine dehydrogenase Mo-binding subunit